MACVVCITILYFNYVLIFLAEKECCDGSDERPGLCPNICKEIGDVYQQQRKQERKIQKTVIILTAQLFYANCGSAGFQSSFHIHYFRSKGKSASWGTEFVASWGNKGQGEGGWTLKRYAPHLHYLKLNLTKFILGIAERTESVSKAALDHKMKSREFIHPHLYLLMFVNTCNASTYAVTRYSPKGT